MEKDKKISKAGMFHNKWLDYSVPTNVMVKVRYCINLLAARSDNPMERQQAYTAIAELDGCLRTPWWRDICDNNQVCVPTTGEEYLCCDEDGTYIAICGGKDDDGELVWIKGDMHVYPRYWTTLPYTPYEDLRTDDEVY